MGSHRGSTRKKWKPSIESDPVTVDIERRLHTSSEIDTQPANIETLSSYEERIGDYKANAHTYIPLPGDKKYYNTEEGWVRELNTSQVVDEDTHLMEILRLLQEEPFLLVDYESNSMVMFVEGNDEPTLLVSDPHESDSDRNILHEDDIDTINMDNLNLYSIGRAKETYPNFAEQIDKQANKLVYDEERYGIITLADVNRRGVRIMIYVVFSGLVSKLSHKIESEYPNSESILKYLRTDTIGRWYKDRMEGLELHVAEHMNLIEIMQVIQASEKYFVKECGFESKQSVEDLGSINNIRNKVMHANRSLIYDRRDIQDIISSIDRSQEILTEMGQ